MDEKVEKKRAKDGDRGEEKIETREVKNGLENMI